MFIGKYFKTFLLGNIGNYADWKEEEEERIQPKTGQKSCWILA